MPAHRIIVIGCGVVGAAIAYELSLLPNVSITVLDRQLPARASSGAALGVLMGIVSQKVKGKAWRLRETSIQRFATLIPELEQAIGRTLPVNQQGIVRLRTEAEDLDRWQTLEQTRQQQGWPLHLWTRDDLQHHCPQVQNQRVVGAVYSPADRQIDPTALTLALVEAAQQRGVSFEFSQIVQGFSWAAGTAGLVCQQVQTQQDKFAADSVVIAAGLGSTELTEAIDRPTEIRPVLGQALRLRLPQPLGRAEFQPVVTGEDVHMVPLGHSEYWVGATVEFPDAEGQVTAEPDRLQAVLQRATEFCPALAQAEVLQTWSGLRPRPFNRPAPLVEPLPGYQNLFLATGHYRNGVLLAPATALQVRDWLLGQI